MNTAPAHSAGYYVYFARLDGRPDRKMMVAKDAYDLDVCGCSPGCRWAWFTLENGNIRRLQSCHAKARGLLPC